MEAGRFFADLPGYNLPADTVKHNKNLCTRKPTDTTLATNKHLPTCHSPILTTSHSLAPVLITLEQIPNPSTSRTPHRKSLALALPPALSPTFSPPSLPPLAGEASAELVFLLRLGGGVTDLLTLLPRLSPRLAGGDRLRLRDSLASLAALRRGGVRDGERDEE